MRIVCPGCTAVYDVPPALADGRRMRCARCRHEFTPEPVPRAPAEPVPRAPAEPVAVAPPPAALPAPWPAPAAPSERLQRDAAPPRPRPRPRPALRGRAGETILALAVSVLVLCGAAGAAYVWRAQVIAFWSPSQRLYQALGLVGAAQAQN